MTTPVNALRTVLRPVREWHVWVTGCMAVVMLAISEAKAQSSGLITRSSRYSLNETLQRLERAAAERGLAVFARIDPRGGQRQNDAMRSTHLLVLGGTEGGTPVMQAAPSASIDLPLKVLVAEDADGRTEVSIEDAGWLARDSGVPRAIASDVAALPALVDAALS